MSTIQLKRGDTFSLTCTYKVDGVAVSLSNTTIRSQVRSSSSPLVDSLLVTKLSATGVFTLVATAAQTRLWNVELLECDIEFINNDITRSTNTFNIQVERDVTI